MKFLLTSNNLLVPEIVFEKLYCEVNEFKEIIELFSVILTKNDIERKVNSIHKNSFMDERAKVIAQAYRNTDDTFYL